MMFRSTAFTNRPRWILAAIIVLALGGSSSAAWASSANGGNSVATASNLPLGTMVSGGGTETDCWESSGSGAEFWRVTVPAGAVLVADYASVNGSDVAIHVLHPTETDFTLDNAESVANAETDGKDELRFRANITGSWIVVMSADCTGDYGYQLTATVQSKSTVTLRAPKRTIPNHQVTLTGYVGGADGGTVLLQYQRSGSWHTFATVDVGRQGGFTWHGQLTGRCKTNATWSNRAVYPGDPEHPSGASGIAVTTSAC